MATKIDVKALEGQLDELKDQLIFKPEEMARYVRQCKAGLHSYSLNNYLLAIMQYPRTSVLAGYRKWQELGRQVKRGEKGIKILSPRKFKTEDKEGKEEEILYFRPVSVFDIKQTGVVRDFSTPWDGRHYRIMDEVDQYLPVGTCQNAHNSGDLRFDYLERNSPVPVHVVKKFQFSDGKTDNKNIWITERPEPQKIAAYFHELGHIFLDHFKTELSREVQEVEAEAVSYICCSYYGIDNPDAAKYIMNWKGDKSLLDKRGDNILNVVKRIIKIFDKEE